MIRVDADQVARQVVHTFLHPRAGELISVNGEARSQELLRALAVEIARAGAFPEVRVSDLELRNRLLKEAPASYLTATPEYRLRRVEEVDASISIFPERMERARAGVPLERLRLAAQGSLPMRDLDKERILDGKYRWVTLSHPSVADAEGYGVEYERFHDLVWGATLTDYEWIGDLEDRLVQRILGRDEVHITCAKGTDLRFRIGKRSVFTLRGEHRLADGGYYPNRTYNVPEGEISIGPIETSAEGRIIFDLAHIDGCAVRDLALTFREGRVVEATAADDAGPFHRLMERETGAKDRLGELGIGTNPAIDLITGDDGLDEKMIGTIHLAIGDNRDYGPGACNRSSHHKDFVLQKPTVTFDGEPFMEVGDFVGETIGAV